MIRYSSFRHREAYHFPSDFCMPPPSSELRHPIKVVCHRTGLTAHVIRVWGKRYGLVCCQRTDSNRRLYSDAMIERLRLLKELTSCGHRIGQIACLCLDDLRTLHERELPPSDEDSVPREVSATSVEECLAICFETLRKLDAPALIDLLEDARLRHGQCTTLFRIVAPLMRQVNEAWHRGELRMAHERLGTSVVRDFVALGARNLPRHGEAPEIVIATPTGQVHEVGALLAAAAARGMGWRAIYLGPSLPAAEIAACAQIRKARAVALSLEHPADQPDVLEELRNLRRLLPSTTAMVIGGRVATGYHHALHAPDVQLVTGLADFESILASLRCIAS
jgi:DNA-binding transcriptional MerR regulator/methylmalonyl-CoA mutase cobalamin-binding subunit